MILPIEKQVCSLELAKKLMGLGVNQESEFVWCDSFIDGWRVFYKPINKRNRIAAFTVAELGAMLPPDRLRFANWKGFWYCELFDYSGDPTSPAIERLVDHNEANTRAKMLIFLIEQGLVQS